MVKKNNRVVTLAVAAFLQLFLGIIYVWSVFVAPVSEYFNNWEISQVKLTSSFMLCFFVLGILTGGKIQSKINSQKSVLIGGLLLSAGMLASAFIPKDLGFIIYITYGIIGGFGVGMGYNAVITTAQRSFPDKRGLATGISVCSFGFSTVIFAPLIETLVVKIGLRNTFLTLGGIFLIVVLACFSFIKMPGEAAAAASDKSTKKQYATKEILKTKEFYYLTISKMTATATFFVLNPSFKTLAGERGLTAGLATALVMMTGIANALGRLGIPLLSDKIGREKAAFLAVSATALGALCLTFVTGPWLFLVIAVIAFCYGGFSGVYPVITGDWFGLKNVGSNYGAVMVGFAVSSLIFPMIFNPIANATVKFVSLAIVAAVGASFMFLLKISKKK